MIPFPFRSLRVILALVVVLVGCGGGPAFGLGQTWDGKHVEVSGTIENLDGISSAKGKYEIFRLCSRGCVTVLASVPSFAHGRLDIVPETRVTVRGTFRANMCDTIGSFSSVHGAYVRSKSAGCLLSNVIVAD
jgi:hypothetical protein